ncbi:MAG TPA: OmpA family protein [Blastocatellia bacterium]|nr:OmpA family protein [Blastocatellia bacterium]
MLRKTFFVVVIAILLLFYLGACNKPKVAHRVATPLTSAGIPPDVHCVAEPDRVIKGVRNQIVTVRTKATDPDNTVLTYSWVGSGGAKITGTGSTIIIDTKDLPPDDYTATVTVSNNRSTPVSCTSRFVVREDDCVAGVSLFSNAKEIEYGTNDKVTLHVVAPDPDGVSLTYEWSTDRGKIIGSGDTVRLDTTGLEPGRINVRVTVSDGPCTWADSTSISVSPPFIDARPAILTRCDYKRINESRPNDECKAFLDDTMAKLRRDYHGTLVIQGFCEEKENAAIAQKRAECVRDYLIKNGIDSARVKAVSSGSHLSPAPDMPYGNKVALIWLVPEGETIP